MRKEGRRMLWLVGSVVGSGGQGNAVVVVCSGKRGAAATCDEKML